MEITTLEGLNCGLTSLVGCGRVDAILIVEGFQMKHFYREILFGGGLFIVGLTLGILHLSGVAHGVADLPSSNVPVFTPNGLYTEALTGVSVTRDLRLFRAYCIRTTVDTGKKRNLPTSAKGSYPQVSVSTGLTIEGVHKATPFLNLSGVTGTLERM